MTVIRRSSSTYRSSSLALFAVMLFVGTAALAQEMSAGHRPRHRIVTPLSCRVDGSPLQAPDGPGAPVTSTLTQKVMVLNNTGVALEDGTIDFQVGIAAGRGKLQRSSPMPTSIAAGASVEVATTYMASGCRGATFTRTVLAGR